MRVAFISHYPQLYGANRSLLNLIDGLRNHGVHSFVIARESGDVTEALQHRGVPFLVVPFEWWVWGRPKGSGLIGRLRSYLRWRCETVRRLRRNLLALPEIIRQLKSWRIDVVYTNSSVTPVGAMAARLSGLPHVWHLREFCDLHYGLEFDWGRRISERIIGRAEAIISISRALDDYYLKDVAETRKRVVYNGVATLDEFDRLHTAVPDRAADKGAFTFAMVGLIHPGKGHEEALRALATIRDDHPGVRLLIVGGGDAAPLVRLAAELGLGERVEFRGYVEDPFRVFVEANAVLMCSRNEAMGRVTVEAMAACRPVIGYDQGGTSELIEHEHTGLLYQGGPEALADCMRRLLTDPAWSKHLGENGWHSARDRFCVEAYAEGVYQVLADVAG